MLTFKIKEGNLQMTVWKMQDAKVQLSALVQQAISSGPQFITLRGESAVVVISQVEYDALVQRANNKVQKL